MRYIEPSKAYEMRQIVEIYTYQVGRFLTQNVNNFSIYAQFQKRLKKGDQEDNILPLPISV